MRAEILRVEEGMKAVRPETGITFDERWNVPGLVPRITARRRRSCGA
jgi:hypothetical protein